MEEIFVSKRLAVDNSLLALLPKIASCCPSDFFEDSGHFEPNLLGEASWHSFSLSGVAILKGMLFALKVSRCAS